MADLAEIVRGESARYLQSRFVPPNQRKALHDIVCCRTAAMGSVSVTCDRCGMDYQLYCSCRNRSCPQCQGEARAKWLEARKQEILPVPYSHVVFTVPREFNDVAVYCPEVLFDVLIRAAGQAVIDVGSSKLHAQLGCQAQLQTWGQSMAWHLHVHCVVPCGGISEDGSRWIAFEAEDLPVKALSNRFRTLLRKGVQAATRQRKLDGLPDTVSIDLLLVALKRRECRVYVKPPFGGVEKLLEYLARYTYRVAITNDRIVSYEDHQVTFRWRDYRHGNVEKLCHLDGQEFLRRFLMHVPPRGFVRIRSYGFLGNRNRKQNIERARQLIGKAETPRTRDPFQPLRLCPACAGREERTFHLASRPEVVLQVELPLRSPPLEPIAA
jgi:hypothetical protein